MPLALKIRRLATPLVQCLQRNVVRVQLQLLPLRLAVMARRRVPYLLLRQGVSQRVPRRALERIRLL